DLTVGPPKGGRYLRSKNGLVPTGSRRILPRLASVIPDRSREGDEPFMRKLVLTIYRFGSAGVLPALAQSGAYPPLAEYMMSRDAEVALARSAAPGNVSGRATIKVLTQSGYTVADKGDNGFVCMVMRGWSAPTYTPEPFRDLVYDATVRAPICFDPAAARTVMPYYELRSKLAMEGHTPDRIAQRVEAAYARGELPPRDGVTFA